MSSVCFVLLLEGSTSRGLLRVQALNIDFGQGLGSNWFDRRRAWIGRV
jgi:hypothetical protein